MKRLSITQCRASWTQGSHKPTGVLLIAAVLLLGMTPVAAVAAPELADPDVGTLELVTPSAAEQAKLDMIDGLAFDSFGNLFAVLEITGAGGGVVYVDKDTGVVTPLVTGISRADQIALHPSGNFFVTSETGPASVTERVYRIVVGYDVNNVPVAGDTTAATITTSLDIGGPEGLIVLKTDGPYGNTGDLYVAEHRNPGSIFRVQPSDGTTSVLASGLAAPEGLAFGDFVGARAQALYVAETDDHDVLRVDSSGGVSVFGNPTAVNLINPDNIEFGPDGFLYVSEDRFAPNSRIIRIAADGTYSVFATGFGAAQGMVFNPANGDLYISEQAFDRIWRVQFAEFSVPVFPIGGWLSLAALLTSAALWISRRKGGTLPGRS